MQCFDAHCMYKNSWHYSFFSLHYIQDFFSLVIALFSSPSRWPSSFMWPTSLSVWCGEGVWTLTTSQFPTWQPWGTYWAPASWPSASAAFHWLEVWVSEFFPFASELLASHCLVAPILLYLHRDAFDWTIKHFLIFITGQVHTAQVIHFSSICGKKNIQYSDILKHDFCSSVHLFWTLVYNHSSSSLSVFWFSCTN